MAINITCKCGKQFRAKDEYAGRRGLCPSCKREFFIEPPIELPSADAASEILAAIDTGTLLAENPSTAVNRRWFRDPIVMVGGMIPTTIAIGFGIYLVGRQPEARRLAASSLESRATNQQSRDSGRPDGRAILLGTKRPLANPRRNPRIVDARENLW